MSNAAQFFRPPSFKTIAATTPPVSDVQLRMTLAKLGLPQPRRGKHAFGRHIIRRITKDGRTYELHATKGWRSYRAA